jgi:hypothetical protein
MICLSFTGRSFATLRSRVGNFGDDVGAAIVGAASREGGADATGGATTGAGAAAVTGTANPGALTIGAR